MNTILLATDGSPSAENATGMAIELALETGRPLHVVTVWWIPASAFGFPGPATVPDTAELERAHGSSLLADVRQRAREAGVEATIELREGPAVDQICACAEERGASLVVLGAHGWGTVKRLVFGSVSSGVLHHAPCPVLVVRGAAPIPAQPEAEAKLERV